MTTPRRGRLHHLLLDALPGDGEMTSVYQVLWNVAREDREIRKGEIRESYESSVKRALGELISRGEVVSGGPRRISSLDELCLAYPYRTRREVVFDMRTRLLPFVKEYATKEGSRKSAADVEASTFQSFSFRSGKIEEIRRSWSDIDLGMRQILSRVDADEANAIINLLVRGRHLFDPAARVTSDLTFVDLCDAVFPMVQRVDSNAAVMLEHLSRKTFPCVSVRVALLKREVYKCVTQHRYEPEALLPGFEAFLLERDPTYVSPLLAPWYSSPKGRAGAQENITPLKPPERGERVLDKLLLRDITKAVRVYGRP